MRGECKKKKKKKEAWLRQEAEIGRGAFKHCESFQTLSLLGQVCHEKRTFEEAEVEGSLWQNWGRILSSTFSAYSLFPYTPNLRPLLRDFFSPLGTYMLVRNFQKTKKLSKFKVAEKMSASRRSKRGDPWTEGSCASQTAQDVGSQRLPRPLRALIQYLRRQREIRDIVLGKEFHC